jgi:uncharacterized protein YdhG (YjbR/CyaY superfamily)
MENTKMNEEVKSYLAEYNDGVQQLFQSLRDQIINSIPHQVEEKLWAKIPSYYVENRFIRLIPFQNHINVEAIAILDYKNELSQFKITPKGMLQIYLNQPIPKDILSTIVKETLLTQKK